MVRWFPVTTFVSTTRRTVRIRRESYYSSRSQCHSSVFESLYTNHSRPLKFDRYFSWTSIKQPSKGQTSPNDLCRFFLSWFLYLRSPNLTNRWDCLRVQSSGSLFFLSKVLTYPRPNNNTLSIKFTKI